MQSREAQNEEVQKTAEQYVGCAAKLYREAAKIAEGLALLKGIGIN